MSMVYEAGSLITFTFTCYTDKNGYAGLTIKK